MQTLGLSAADAAEYGAALAASHVLGIEVRILNLSGDLIASLKVRANAGQINIDADRDVTRSATLQFQDDARSLQFDPDSPADGAVYFSHMVQVRHTVWVNALDKAVTCAVFTGPVVAFDRSGDEVSIEAQGKESFALQGVPTLTLPKGKNAIDAIRDILSLRCGEDLFAFPTTTRRLPKAVVVGWAEETRPWTVCKAIAASLGLQLFYDGAGVCRLRALPSAPSFTFKTGEGGTITQPVQVSHDKEEMRNRVRVIGSKPAHTYDATLPSTHPFSPQALARNGIPQYIYEEVTESNLGSKTAAKARADALLAQYARMEFGTTFSALPVPHLDELDLVRIDTDEYVGTQRVRQLSFPLAGGDMAVGYNAIVSLPQRKRK